MATRSYEMTGTGCRACCCECTVTMQIVPSGACSSPQGNGLSYAPRDCDPDADMTTTLTVSLAGFTREWPQDVGVVSVTAPASIQCGTGGSATYYHFSHWQVWECITNESDMEPGPGGPPPSYYCWYGLTVPIAICPTGSCDATAKAYYGPAICTTPTDYICTYLPGDVECPPS